MQLLHFLQSMYSGKFREYDHREQNMEYYNSTSPPDYDVTKIVAPVYLYHAVEDLLVSRTVRTFIVLSIQVEAN